jgi:pimeloyl-ACP methyl ester carboxylesterase
VSDVIRPNLYCGHSKEWWNGSLKYNYSALAYGPVERTQRATQKLNEVIAMREFPTDVEYDERGEGPPLLLLPGSFGTGSGWKAVTDRLARSHRIVTTSLLGYGATAERRPRGNATMR